MAFYTGTFTDTELVKKDASFEGNADISEENDVTLKVKAAEAEIQGALFEVYELPLSVNALFTGSTAEEYLQELAKQLACGFLLMSQFRGQGGELFDLAEGKVEEARDKLKSIKNGDVRLLDTAFEELNTITSGLDSISGFPNSEDDTDEPDDNENAKFTMDQVF